MVMMEENDTGKMRFFRMLAGRVKPDEGGELPVLNVRCKPQSQSKINWKYLPIMTWKSYEIRILIYNL